MSAPEGPQYVRISHVPEHRNVTLPTVFKWARTGLLPTLKLESRRTFVDLDDVDALLGPPTVPAPA